MTAVTMAEPLSEGTRVNFPFYPQYRLSTTYRPCGDETDYSTAAVTICNLVYEAATCAQNDETITDVFNSGASETGPDLDSLLRNLQMKLQQCALTGQLHVALQACTGSPDAGTESSWEDVSKIDIHANASQDTSMESVLQKLKIGLQQGARTGVLQTALQTTKGGA
eukprot:gnl/MRDRNA2_/MRDRNA2_82628_c0_seq1.p1 gnl/MRDRNA2_/MRDRNA2_82628_c0~~gnl/MRDRNA2_/MRDRNA2_82628_c0_seq1.p1  ORF type:complete len:167 (-),score=24.54 gnl/MRDRNA2_/MRDRNA2_82628_c0_seq1:318-818(-)